MSISLAQLAQAQWEVDYDNEGDLLVFIPATRETGLLTSRLFFRLMNMPEDTEVHVVFYETDYKVFRENELGYKEDDYHYGSRAYALARRMASDKIKTYALVESNKRELQDFVRHAQRSIRGLKNILFYGLSSSNYQTNFFSIFEQLLTIENDNDNINILGVYINGNSSHGLTTHLVNKQEDAVGIINRPFDDSLQTQLTVSTVMFNVLNKWISGTTLGTKTIGVDLSTGEINPIH